ncbi:NAD-dependent protein deacetylase sirtuin-7 isoform X2 [Phymastichus coffea]|uniref:NAD-dependent protein deacetylase sirtuin-7 isoform X2 n=1 Tax=Phymastichus coffea TaxID=108790 RepID=UPI00273AFA27|nr:NAD-dependent protein deacetylase sirtuin-7 isoform X2 [Phymastichus coffea]
MEEIREKKFLCRRRCTIAQSLKAKDERTATVKKVTAILQKSEINRTPEECELLDSCRDIVKEITRRQEKRNRVKARLEEVEDQPDILEEKCIRLAAAISRATSLAVYTGAGISTAASIPDYRGTNGVWTRLQQGKDIGNHDLSQAEPTLTHMALYALYKARILKHIVSQNCDGLHLRSGIPRSLLSEVHGNMYVEVCRNCKPSREYWRLFDVTEKTARYAHATGRTCHKCHSSLQDSIVHFGERGNLLWPINWNGASRAAKQADVILCLGSSLKVLKKYPWLWQMDKPVSKRPQLYIVNLQWTPKDDSAVLKINGKCDEVMKIVMSHLGIDIPNYNRAKDPIFYHAIKLATSEMSTTSNPSLEAPTTLKDDETEGDVKKENIVDKMENYDGSNDIEVIKEMPKNNGGNNLPVDLMDNNEMVNEEASEKVEQEYEAQITIQEPITAYPAPFFTALPFISMGLPFPPIYMYPLTPIFYYPFIQMPSNAIAKEDCPPKPKPACTFCMEYEGSLTCLYYQHNCDVDDNTDMTDSFPNSEPSDDNELQNGNDSEIQDGNDKEMVTDENVPTIVAAKNPGWFGKGYRKGIKRKR